LVVVVIAIGLFVHFHRSSAGPSADVTAYSHTGVIAPSGLAAQGQYVWIADNGEFPQRATGVNHGEKVVRVDVATGAATPITSPLFSVPYGVVTTHHFVWVLNEGYVTRRLSISRINEATLAVTRVTIPARIDSVFGHDTQGPFVLAGGSLWISTGLGIIRVDTKTLAVSTITSPLLTGGPYGSDVVADAHYLWLSESVLDTGPTVVSTAPRYLVRVSMNTGTVSKIRFKGFNGGSPIADDGTNLWIEDSAGIDRFNFATGRDTLFVLPDSVFLTSVGLGVVANGSVYLAATEGNDGDQGALVRIRIASGQLTIVSSPFLHFLQGVTTANGDVWVINNTQAGPDPVHEPALVRLTLI
jgi:streptogramin lyase